MSSVLDKIKKMLEGQKVEAYSRYDGQHPLDIFLGIDSSGRKSLVVTLQADKQKVISSKTITVEFFSRSDGRTSLRFSLEDDSLKDIFYKLCEDIIESTRLSSTESGFSTVIERWNTWISFFSKTSLPLSESEVLGLIGEVYFLQSFMAVEYGLNAALESYIGADRAHKDFEIHDTWYEIKSIHHGGRSVKISSIEQLNSTSSGKLEIITFDQGTPNSEGNITINGIVSDFKRALDQKQQLSFDEKMRKSSYMEDERYDEYNYIFVGLDEYNVVDGFPKISKDILPNGVTKVSYEIDISAIQQYKASL